MRVRERLELHHRAHGFTREAYAARRFVVTLGPVSVTLPNPGRLPSHDLHHVALGVPSSFWGEVEVSALELRTGAPTLLIAILCAGAVACGFMLAPRRVVRTWRSFRGARNLYTGAPPIERLYELEVDALRAWMRLPPGAGTPT